MLYIIVAVLDENEIIAHQKLNSSIPNKNIIYVSQFPPSRKYDDLRVVTQDRTGIYNALNFGIKALPKDAAAYVVCGSDDIIFFEQCLSAWNDLRCFITGRFYIGASNTTHQAKRWIMTDAHKAIISEHSVGTIIPIEIHREHGMYDEKYKIAGDADLILRLSAHNVYPVQIDTIFGRYATTGISQTQYLLGQSELQGAMNKYFPLRALFFNLFRQVRIMVK